MIQHGLVLASEAQEGDDDIDDLAQTEQPHHVTSVVKHHTVTFWNSLPGTITDNLNITVPTFKSKLKTHLYACCYLGL